MTEVGLRELRQQASELVRQVEAGASITVTVNGRPAARLAPVGRAHWRRWEDVAAIFEGAADPDWERDRSLVDQRLVDPFDR